MGEARGNGIFLEIKEAERPDLAVDRVARLLEATGAADRVLVISLDHVVLKRGVERHPGIRTQVITHARHADIIGVLRGCGARSVSIELDMFHAKDAKALHDAGFSNRVSLPGAGVLAEYWRGGRDIIPSIVQWIAEGLIDTCCNPWRGCQTQDTTDCWLPKRPFPRSFGS